MGTEQHDASLARAPLYQIIQYAPHQLTRLLDAPSAQDQRDKLVGETEAAIMAIYDRLYDTTFAVGDGHAVCLTLY